ncbi:hypothetical protein BST61_g1873 [Cercospora zeina]
MMLRRNDALALAPKGDTAGTLLVVEIYQSHRVAFVSGHIDLPEAQFLEHYRKALDSAIDAKDQFIVSNAEGADSLALQYLLRNGVDPTQITVYIHTPPERRQKSSNANMRAIDELRTGDAILEQYRKQGLNVRVVKGWHTQRL